MGKWASASWLSAVGSAVFIGVACGGTEPNGFGPGGSSSGSGDGGGGPSSSSGGSSGGNGVGSFGDDASGSGGSSGSGGGGTPGAQCPSGAQCNVPCAIGGTTSISGKVYDPALKDGLYDIAVYVPGGPIQTLPKGVPRGADACNCGALFKSGAVVSTATAVDGSFKLTNAPVGKQIPLVLQIGKWRRVVHVDTNQCADAPQPDKSLSLPGTLAGAGPDDNMPDIAVSTGNADTLECLMKRIGVPDSEYVAGAGGTGHVHVFSGGTTGGGLGFIGGSEAPAMQGAPASSASLWDSAGHLLPFDIVLLSCEGGETYDANPAALEEYLNAGGRAFASHFHYAWFSGPMNTKGVNSYTAPADWGNNLATWTAGIGGIGTTANGTIVQTLNGSTNPFPKGVFLYEWLGINGALGVQGAPAHELPIFQPRFNSVVVPADKPSQAWINDAATSNTMYFSFDTPINAPVDPKTGQPAYCGRAVFSDLHVSGNPQTTDTSPPPAGCAAANLSPQEKALEFMLFDLSSCVIPDTETPPDAGVPTLQ
jgi:hypothetical protein